MRRRTFLRLAALATLGLPGCIESAAPGGDPAAPAYAGGTAMRQGTIADQLLSAGMRVDSGLGPSSVTGRNFTTTVSLQGAGLVSLSDAAGQLRGLCVTLPSEPIGFDLKSSALAVLFLQAGVGTADATVAARRRNDLLAQPGFADLLAVMQRHVTEPLDFLAALPEFAEAVDAVVAGLGLATADQGPLTAARDGATVHLTNPSDRFVGLVRHDLDGGGGVLAQTSLGLIEPFGSLDDAPPGAANYLARGPGSPAELPTGPDLFGDPFGPTAFAHVVLPLLELVAGRPVDLPTSLQAFAIATAGLPDPGLDQALTAGDPDQAAGALDAYQQLVLQNLVEGGARQLPKPGITHTPSSTPTATPTGPPDSSKLEELAGLLTGSTAVAGFGFVTGSIFKLRQHKDNPTQIPIGAPIALVFVAAALLFLPSILSVSA